MTNQEVKYDFSGIKKVGALNVTQGSAKNMGVIRFPDLEEVEGLFRLSDGFSSKVQPSEFPKLRKVNSLVYTGVIDVLDFPSLEEVTGECSISTAYWNGVMQGMLQEIRVPMLKKVGSLVLKAASAYGEPQPNTILTSLDCFMNLESAGSVKIEKQMGLISYEGLQKAITGITDPELWEVSGNAYNPTFDEAKAGKLVQP